MTMAPAPPRHVTSRRRCAIGRAVRALLSLLAAIMLLTSLGVSTVAHAGEPIGCMDMTVSVTTPDHVDCGMVQVPADADKGYPHHHGVCHGHQIAAPADTVGVPRLGRAAGPVGFARVARLTAALGAAALEPPRT